MARKKVSKKQVDNIVHQIIESTKADLERIPHIMEETIKFLSKETINK